jgi:hypothetical protein
MGTTCGSRVGVAGSATTSWPKLLLTRPWDGRQACGRLPSPLPKGGERIRRTSSRLGPLNPVGTRSTASPSSGLQLGTQWNASLPVPAGRFMGRAGVRGEKVENPPISAAHLPDDRPPLTLPSPLPPGAERENRRTPVAYPRACSVRACLKNVWLPRARPRPSSFVLGLAGNSEDEGLGRGRGRNAHRIFRHVLRTQWSASLPAPKGGSREGLPPRPLAALQTWSVANQWLAR